MVRRLMVAAALLGVTLLVGASPAHALDDQNCGDFPSQAAAQQHLREDPSDPDRLDADHDGVACETTSYPVGSARDETPVGASQTPATTATTAAPARVVSSSDGSITVSYEQPAPIVRVAAAPRARSLAATGPRDAVPFIAAAALVLIGFGSRMRGRRAVGDHWLA